MKSTDTSSLNCICMQRLRKYQGINKLCSVCYCNLEKHQEINRRILLTWKALWTDKESIVPLGIITFILKKHKK